MKIQLLKYIFSQKTLKIELLRAINSFENTLQKRGWNPLKVQIYEVLQNKWECLSLNFLIVTSNNQGFKMVDGARLSHDA